MKKTIAIILALVLGLCVLTACSTQTENEGTKEETKKESVKKETESKAEDSEKDDVKTIAPLPSTIDIDNLEDCTVSVSLEKGDAYVDDSGKMVMKLKVYTYDLYDMVDIASLKENDVIIRLDEEVKVTEVKRLDSGLVSINGGEENGGFDLISNDDTVYYEIGMSDVKAYYELGEATIPVSTEFEYIDESEIDSEAKKYYPGDFLTDDAGIEYNFSPNNTSVVIEDGYIIKMNKTYMP